MQNKDLLVKIRNAIKRLNIPIEIELERYNKKIVKIIFLFGKIKTLSEVAAELT